MSIIKSTLSDEVIALSTVITNIETNYNLDVNRIGAVETEIDTKVDGPFWIDILGDISARATGSTAPTLASMIGGNVKAWFYDTNNEVNLDYHIPHEIVLDEDMYLHLHWGHNGTAISGNLTIRISMTYAKGHNQSTFPTEKVFNMVIPASNLTVAPRYGHIVSEIQISAAIPTTSLLDRSIIEPDGKILINCTVVSLPTITGGSPNKPYWLAFDLHCLSTGRGTKNRSPNFYI